MTEEEPDPFGPDDPEPQDPSEPEKSPEIPVEPPVEGLPPLESEVLPEDPHDEEPLPPSIENEYCPHGYDWTNWYDSNGFLDLVRVHCPICADVDPAFTPEATVEPEVEDPFAPSREEVLAQRSALDLAREIAVLNAHHLPSEFDAVERIELVAIAAGIVGYKNRKESETDPEGMVDCTPFHWHPKSMTPWKFGLHVIDIAEPGRGKSSGIAFLKQLLGDSVPAEAPRAISSVPGFFGGWRHEGKGKAKKVYGPAFRARRGGVIFLSEFGSIIPFLQLGAGNGGNRSAILDFLSEGIYAQDVLKGDHFEYQLWTTVIGGIQPELWEMLEPLMGMGLSRRFTYVRRPDLGNEERASIVLAATEGWEYDEVAIGVFRSKIRRIVEEFAPTEVTIRRCAEWLEARVAARNRAYRGDGDELRILVSLSAGYYVLAKWKDEKVIDLPTPDDDPVLAEIVERVFDVRASLVGDEDQARLERDSEVLWDAGLGSETEGYFLAKEAIRILAGELGISTTTATYHVEGWRSKDDKRHPGLLPRIRTGEVDETEDAVFARAIDLQAVPVDDSPLDRMLERLGFAKGSRGPRPKIWRWIGSPPPKRPKEAAGGVQNGM